MATFCSVEGKLNQLSGIMERGTVKEIIKSLVDLVSVHCKNMQVE
jgi:hypothetical protein